MPKHSTHKNVTLSVHRAIIDENFSWSLSDLLSKIKKQTNPNDHIMSRGFWSKTAIKFPQFPQTDHAVSAQFALYEEGAEKSTIRPEQNNQAYSTKPIQAPAKDEFLEHEVAILVDGNYMIACNLGNRRDLLIDALGQLAEASDVSFSAGCMAFAPIPDKLTVDIIRSRGVKYIKFDAANFLGSLDVSTSSLIGHLFGASSDAKAYKREEMIAELSIRPKNKKLASLEFEEVPKNEWLEKTAIKTHQDEQVDSYTIILTDDTEWKDGDLKLFRSIKVAKDGSSYSIEEALSQMLKYLDELQDGGHLG